MFLYNTPFYGMHLLWWLFWGAVWVMFFSFLTPVPRRRWQEMRETPLDVLKRRLASGEIDAPEYEKRKELIERDDRSASPGRSTRLSSTPAPQT